ncbi:MAG: sigma-70 family RNA polymerase sigma factor [Enterocloster asparagiformis]|nr:sigma-70 family RNA polymerase sigma factor [Enterocloster asparagiformis]
METVRDKQLEEAVRLARQGDSQAFEQLYRLTYKYVYFHAKSILNDTEAAWDLVQDTYVIVYRKLDTLREDRLIKPWIGGIVFNLGYKRLKKKTDVLLGEGQEFLFDEMEVQDSGMLPEQALDQKETVQIIQDVIEQLPPLQKAAVIAYYFDEKGVADIAREAGCSDGTIKSRLNYARKSIRERILQKEREMGVTLHTVTGPMILWALMELFAQTQVSPRRAAMAFQFVGKKAGFAAVGAVGAANAAGGNAAGGTAAGSGGANAAGAAGGKAAGGTAVGSGGANAAGAAGGNAAGGTAAGSGGAYAAETGGAQSAGAAGGKAVGSTAGAGIKGAGGTAAGTTADAGIKAAGSTAAGAKAAGATAVAGAKAAAAGGKGIAAIIGAAKIPLVCIAASAVIGTGVGVGNYYQEQASSSRAVEQAAEREAHREPSREEARQSSPQTAAEEVKPQETKPAPGWENGEDGRRYRDRDGNFLAHTWKEIGGNLYYFKKDGIAATGQLRLGRQTYAFDSGGKLTGMSYSADGVFYDEDVKYYGGDGVFVSGLDGSDERLICPAQGVMTVAESEGVLYYFCNEVYTRTLPGQDAESEGKTYGYWEAAAYRVNVDGSGTSRFGNGGWVTAKDIIVVDGKGYMSWTDVGEGDGDLPHGSLIVLEPGGPENGTKIMDLESQADYRQLQKEDGWIYFINTNPLPEFFGGSEVYRDALLRVSLEDQTVQRVIGSDVEAYFVYGETIYYMKNGVMNRMNIHESDLKIL